MSELPRGWAATTLQDVTSPRGEKAYPSELSDMRFIAMDHIEAHTSRLLSTQSVTELKSAVTLFKVGDILYGRLRPYLNKVHQARFDGAASAEFIVFPPSPVIDQRYLGHLLRSSKFVALAKQRSTGDRPRVSFESVGDFSIDLPPLPEQRRIVTKLDALFTRTKSASDELDRIPLLIEHYKQAILRKAFSGELTADWRDDNGVGELTPWPIPESWTWGKFQDVAEIASNLVAPSEVLDLPHIAPNHIESGIPKLLAYNTVRDDNLKSAKHRFFPGQILYSKIRPYLRKAVAVDFEGVCSADMYPINPLCNPNFLLYWLLSPGFNELAVEHQGRVVLPKINQTALNSIPTPVPPPEEQAEIARRIQMAMDWVSLISAERDKATYLLGRLDKALLTKAFRGDLVPQDPNDEPAEKLLGRIRAKRAASSRPQGRGRKRKSMEATGEFSRTYTPPARSRRT